MNTKDKIVRYIEELCNESDFDHSGNLFDAGLLSSLDVLSIVAFLEDEFGLDISGNNIDMESFGTIDGLVGIVTTQSHAA